MRDYRKEQFISRFKNANISRTEAERKYKLKVEEEEELQRRMFEAMNSQAVQEALEAGGASAAVGGTTESFQVVGENILIYFQSETTSTYQVVAFNYTDNRVSGPTDLGIESSADLYSSRIITGKGSLVHGEGSDYVWYAFLDVNGSIIEQDSISNPQGWNLYDIEGKALALYYINDNILYLKWWTGQSAKINSCEFDCGGAFDLDETSFDHAMADGTINGQDDYGRYWSFLPNGEFYNINDAVRGGGTAVERFSTYNHCNFYGIVYRDGDDYYTGIRILDNKGVVLRDIDTTNYIFDDYNYGYYGENRFWIRLYNGSDVDIPNYYIVYNGNTDTVITKEDVRGGNFRYGINFRKDYGGGYQENANRITNGNVIIFAPDDGNDIGYDGKMDGYYYVKFHALIGDSDEFVTYEHTNDGVESFKYRTDLIYAGNPAFAVKGEDSANIKLMIFKASGVEFHATNLTYTDLEDGTLDVNTMGDNVWLSAYNENSGEWNYRLYDENGNILDGLNLSGNVSWDINGSSAILQAQASSTFYSVSAETPEFVQTPSYYIHWDGVDSCVYSENGEDYSNFFAYGEGYQTETPGVIVSANGTSSEITLADSSYNGSWSSWMTPNYAVWLAQGADTTYTISTYSLDGTLLRHTNLGVTSIQDTHSVGDRVLIAANVDGARRVWMVNGSEIQYTDAITESEWDNYNYREANDWPFDDC
jgi:hypothetical protein